MWIVDQILWLRIIPSQKKAMWGISNDQILINQISHRSKRNDFEIK